jgi:subtilisin family serine protease
MKSITLFIFVACLFATGYSQKVQYHPSRLIVSFDKSSGSDVGIFGGVNLNKYGVDIIRTFNNLGGNMVSVSVKDGSRVETKKQQISKLPGVKSVDYDYVVKALYKDGSSSVNLYGLDKIKAPCAWNKFGFGSCSTKVCVIDTGIDYNHNDLATNSWINPLEYGKSTNVDDDANGYRDDIHGINTVTPSGNPMDDQSHGTHVSGTIAATLNLAGAAGVAPNTKIISCKFLNSQGSGYTSDAIICINYCKGIFEREMKNNPFAQRTGIYSNSWGGGGYSAPLYNAIKAADTGLTRGLFLFAAGNEAKNNDVALTYPASYDLPNIVSVAATDSADVLAGFSNYGKKTVDIAAPGVSIYSTIPNKKYAYYSGTSMATPHVAGVAALLASRKPSATTEELKGALLSGVDVIPGLTGKLVSNGRMNAVKSLNVLLKTSVVC